MYKSSERYATVLAGISRPGVNRVEPEIAPYSGITPRVERVAQVLEPGGRNPRSQSQRFLPPKIAARPDTEGMPPRARRRASSNWFTTTRSTAPVAGTRIRGRDASLWYRHDLMNMLYGTPPLWFMHPKAGDVAGTPEWEQVKTRYLQTYRNVCGWHEKIGFDEMTDHRFLSDDRLVQETRFRNGRGIIVNFSTVPGPIQEASKSRQKPIESGNNTREHRKRHCCRRGNWGSLTEPGQPLSLSPRATHCSSSSTLQAPIALAPFSFPHFLF